MIMPVNSSHKLTSVEFSVLSSRIKHSNFQNLSSINLEEIDNTVSMLFDLLNSQFKKVKQAEKTGRNPWEDDEFKTIVNFCALVLEIIEMQYGYSNAEMTDILHKKIDLMFGLKPKSSANND